MNILHINHFGYPDYLNDMLYHGGRGLFGEGYQSSSAAAYMWEENAHQKSSLYGKGFTLYCRVKRPLIQDSPDQIRQKIADRAYDCILFGSVYRCLDLVEHVLKAYPGNRIAFIDGEDHPHVIWPLVTRGTYFKRELVHDVPQVHPIGFSIPKELFIGRPAKTKLMATVVPGDQATYVFDDEDAYHADYASSYFGHTCRKGGWDCLRHYEIVANWCMPMFKDLDACPHRTMVSFPKAEILEYNRSQGAVVSDGYWASMERIHSHAKDHCTTEAALRKVLERLF